MDNIEVYKQTEGFATELEIGKDLRVMDGRDGLDRLYFHDHQVFCQQVDAVAEFELYSAVNDWETYLCSRTDSGDS
jgi:hypothetical protein